MSENEVEKLKQELFDEKFNNMKKAVDNIQKLVGEIRDNQSKEYEKIRSEMEKNKEETKKEIDNLRTEQNNQKLDYTKFKTKVLSWATAGSAIGGTIVALIK